MKKIFIIFFILYSSSSFAEWISLSCSNNSNQSTIIEFDQAKQQVRIDGDNKKIYNSNISDLKIEWTAVKGELWNEIDRLTGALKRYSVYPSDPPNLLCVSSERKF